MKPWELFISVYLSTGFLVNVLTLWEMYRARQKRINYKE